MAAGELLVVAIDIGTTYSGYAMSLSGRQKLDIHASLSSVDGRLSSSPTPNKVPTALLLKPDGSFHSFGEEAILHYNMLIDEKEQKQWLYFSRFKMKLHETANLSRNTMVAAANGKKFLVKRVFALSLEYFKTAAINQMNTYCGLKINSRDVKWVITVPAIWDDGAKQIMREAAYDGGLASSHDSERVVIALEPEAAALYCKSVNLITADVPDGMNTSLAYESGTRYLLADLGGGTADVAVHEVQSDKKIRELHHATGGAWGGIYVDENYVQLLERIFGKKLIDKFCINRQGDWVDMILNFEKAKRAAEIEKTLYIELSFSFNDFIENEKLTVNDCVNRFNNPDVKSTRKYLSLQYPEVKKLFYPVFSNISSHLKRLLEKVPGVKFMILVGGFSSCKLLQTYIKAELESSFGLRVIISRECSLCVVMGSVLFGHDPLVFLSRRVKYTYGVQSIRDFVQGDPEELRMLGDDGVAKCTKTFTIYVRKNTEIDIGQEITDTFSPGCSDSKEVKIIVCASEDENPRYTTNVRKAAVMLLPMPETGRGKNRIIKVFMTFEATEIAVRSEDVSSGNSVGRKVELDFL